MKLSRSNRATTLTACLAALAIFAAPLTGYKNCCCAIAPASQLTAGEQTAERGGAGEQAAAVANCCSAAAPTAVLRASCCSNSAAAKSYAASQGSAAQCDHTPVAYQLAKSPLHCQDLHCQESCCQRPYAPSAAVVVHPVDQRDAVVDWASLPGLLDTAPWDLFSAAGVVQREPDFLSARAHCAMLCRWLN